MDKSNKGNLTETLDWFLALIEVRKKELGINESNEKNKSWNMEAMYD